MNALRKEEIREEEIREDENLTTADIVNGRDRADAPMTPRQAFAANEPLSSGPPDYTPPPDNRGPQPVPVVPNPAPVASTPIVTPQTATNAKLGPQAVPVAADGSRPAPLFPDDELHNFRARWDEVQGSFVDEPRKAVEQADSLVANVVKRIAEQFAAERENMEKQWDRGDDVNTEDLRQALKRYRGFFDRLLSF